jgi:two-component system, NarL family, response regulator NreC
MEKTRILVVDDHPLLVEGIRSFLSQQERVELVGVAYEGETALRQTGTLRPDVALVDISLPDINGLDLIPRLRQVSPVLKVLVLTMHKEREYILQALCLGVNGYLLKDAAVDELMEAIAAVLSGKLFFSRNLAQQAMQNFLPQPGKEEIAALSRREREVLRLVAVGKSNKEIAALLGIAVRTVQTHRTHLMEKLNIHTVAELTRYALAEGLLAGT